MTIIKNTALRSQKISKPQTAVFYSQEESQRAAVEAEAVLQKAKTEAIAIKKEAEQEAQILLQKAKTEAIAIKKEAEQEGTALGLNQGKIQIQQEFSNQIQALHKIINILKTKEAEFLESVEKQILELVLAIAKKIVKQALKLKPEIILETIKHCLTKTKETQKIIIKVNPQDFNLVSKHKECFLQKIKNAGKFEIQESSSILEGDCILETSNGEINATIKEQFAKIKDSLYFT
ncbi:MAG: flagellar assembly protein FliH [Candidatus Magnetoglobus multicellularis str. Araruama]|uniref:Flagellar assembly protein FliH n=1 Tax=Candidatus Magnetoglobus multicellularis str. Araruama TaxID=890399 RepID=A0A1V1P4F0_9BACT|nr:MAG: flagellar assembly protein FliH [Candidatus Magnetoglobus multicellularis str. Araruama]